MKQHILTQSLKNIAEFQLRKEAEGHCHFWFHQDKLPTSLKEKFKQKKEK